MAVWLVVLAVPVRAQPCNPVIDGTNSAEAGSGAQLFDVRQSDDFIERCLDNPPEKAVGAAAKVKG